MLISWRCLCTAWMLMDSEQNYIPPGTSKDEKQNDLDNVEKTSCPNLYPRYPYIFGMKPQVQSFQYKCKRKILNQHTVQESDDMIKQPDILRHSQNTVNGNSQNIDAINTIDNSPEARDSKIPHIDEDTTNEIVKENHVPKKETDKEDTQKDVHEKIDINQIKKDEDVPYIVKAVPTDKAASQKMGESRGVQDLEPLEKIAVSEKDSELPNPDLKQQSHKGTEENLSEETDTQSNSKDSKAKEQQQPIVEVGDLKPEEIVPPSSPSISVTDPSSLKPKENNDTEPEFASFRQWTLQQEAKKQAEERRKKEEEERNKPVDTTPKVNNTKLRDTHQPTVSLRMKKNFASPDCGAKVIGANMESQGSGKIIVSAKDEYMLNKCTDKGWFVVELCESINAHKIEIANFELFSSVFKNVRVSLGPMYPGKDKVWSLFGEFEAKDERELQTFENPNGAFGKYVKVEISSHYGAEHYCPISLFKIYGISEIELMDDDDDHVSTHEPHQPPEVDQPREQSNMITMIQQKVGETIQGLKGVFTAQEQVRDSIVYFKDYNDSTPFGTTFKYQIICPNCSEECLQETQLLVSEDFQDLLQTLKNPSLRFELTNQICSSYGFNLTSRLHGTCLGDQLVEFFKVLFGTSRILALCNVIAWQEGMLSETNMPLETLLNEQLLEPTEVSIEPSLVIPNGNSISQITSTPTEGLNIPETTRNDKTPPDKIDTTIQGSMIVTQTSKNDPSVILKPNLIFPTPSTKVDEMSTTSVNSKNTPQDEENQGKLQNLLNL